MSKRTHGDMEEDTDENSESLPSKRRNERGSTKREPWEQNPACLFVANDHGELLCVGKLLSSVGGHALGLNTFHIPDGGRPVRLRVAPLPTFALVDTHPSEGEKEEKPFSFPCEGGDIVIPINPRPDSSVRRVALRVRVTNPAWKEDLIVFLSVHLRFCPRLDQCLEPHEGPAVPLEVSAGAGGRVSEAASGHPLRTVCLKFLDVPSMEKESKGGETFSSMLEKVRSRGERKLQTLRQRAERATLKYQQAEKFLETLRASRNLFSGTSSSSTVDLAGEEGGDKEK